MRRAPLCLALLLAAPLAAQTNAERMATDWYSRSHDYDLVHQRIELGGFEWATRSFDGQVTVTLRALRPAFDSVVLDAGALLEVQSVQAAAPGGAAWRWRHVRDTLVVHLPRPAGLGDTVRFTVRYHGVVDNGRGLTFLEADTAPPARPRQLWSQGEDHNNHYWFPTYDFPNDRTTWDMVVTVPRGFTAVSNGTALPVLANRDGTRTFRWRQSQPAVTYLVSLVVAPLVKVPGRWRGRPVDAYVYAADSARAPRLFGVTPDMIETYSRLTGVAYPWPKYAQTTVADFFGGMENVSATTLVDWLPAAGDYVDRPWYQYILIPHELAHQWFGDYVTTTNWANMWLNEGFAEFLPGQYWRVKLGEAAAQDYYLDEYRQYLQIDARRRMPLASLGSNNIYPKGALVLEMLRRRLGNERFWAGVKRYLDDHALGTATTDDLRQAFLAATGENLEPFFSQWMYGAGHPDFDVTAAWDSTIGLVTLTVRQTQRDTLAADSAGLRYQVAEAFTGPVTIRVGTAGGDIRRTVVLEQREQVIHIDGVHQAPTMVVFDEGNTFLKRLTFNQPTAWLATQLATDGDLWDQSWVIDQLEGKAGDAVAQVALARAATGADHPVSRAAAATALAQFPGAATEQALGRALEDTAATVRQAAAYALGQLGATAATPELRRHWQSDPSTEARAAALSALAQLDPAAARTLLPEALAMPSYRDAISNAAAFSAVRLRDTTLIPAIARAAEGTSGGAFALAALGRAGATSAWDRLGDLALSPRAGLRKRALDAFRFAMPADSARARLTALRAAAVDDATRGDLEGALAGLRQ